MLTDEADIFLNLLPLPLHFLDAVLAAFMLQPLQDILVLPNYLQQLSFSVWLIQSLPALSALLIKSPYEVLHPASLEIYPSPRWF